jgi:DNA repair protein RadC
MIVKAKITGKLDSNQKVADALRTWLAAQNIVDQDKEHFWAIGLDTKLKVKYIEVVTMGTLDASLVHPREVFRFAIMNGVASLIIGHNHPSGDVSPSSEDRSVTKRLAEAGRLLGIPLHDHLIIGEGEEFYSFAQSIPQDLNKA